MAIIKTQFPQFVGPSYSTKSMPIDCQLSINWIPTPINSASAKTRYALYPTPGYKHIQFRMDEVLYDELPTENLGSIRGMLYTSTGFYGSTAGTLVVCASESVFEVFPADNEGIHNIRKIGVVSYLNGTVTMADDGFGIVISDNTTLYHIDFKTSVMNSFGTDAPLEATSVTFLNGYTICAGRKDGIENNTFFWSNQYKNDKDNWDALSYASAEGFADPVQAVKRVGNDLWVFGIRSYEVYQGTSSPDLPFAKMSGSAGNIGSASPYSISEIGDIVFFLGSGAMGTRKAYMSSGYSVASISTDALEEEWTGYSSFGDAVSFAYTLEGNTYWCITWLKDNKTYCYCLESQSWFQPATRDPSLDVFNKWRITQGAYAYDKLYVGDATGTKLYHLSSDYMDEDGTQIVRVRRSPHMHDGLSMIRYQSIAIDMETGMGLVTGQGKNPQAMLRYSSDGGRTWSAELWKDAGALGKYKTRMKWSRHGMARDRVYELYCSDPVRWVILGCELETEKSVAGI